jgi:hypothetical protein
LVWWVSGRKFVPVKVYQHGCREDRTKSGRSEGRREKDGTDIKLPSLYVLACVLVGDDYDELGDFAADHPAV